MTHTPHPNAHTITPEVAEELRAMHAIARTVRGNTPPNAPQRKTSVEFTAALQSLIEQGVTVYRLAKVLQVSHTAIYNRLARHGYRTASPSQAHMAYHGAPAHEAGDA
ncbi:hypothetical protein ABTX71_12845 [Streptomyces parvulus]|uniref:hypothetical protein n=1 Tax=Streptomyces parvulus TaxID=146923 RepID=UPI003326C17B